MSENACGKATDSSTVSDKSSLLNDPDWLRQKYHAEGLNQSEIGVIVGRDSSNVSRAMNRHGIETRTGGPKVKYPELHDGEWVREKYIGEFMTTIEIAELLGCGRTHAVRAVKKHVPEEKIRTNGPQGNVIDGGLSDEARQIIEGELLGDGCIRVRYDNPKTAPYKHATSREKYRDWLDEWFQSEGFETRIYYRENTDPAGNTHPSYRLETKQYRCLKGIYDRWYPNGEKRVPEDLELTPLMVRHWFIGDGSNSGNLMLYTDGFTRECCEVLKSELERIGLELAVTKRNRIQLYRSTEDRFFEYMADLPEVLESVYGYKWP